MKLMYCGDRNFGDLLSPFIIGKLSGEKIIRKDYPRSFWFVCKSIIKALLYRDKTYITRITFPREHVVLGIGSILANANKNCTIWGSGFLSRSDSVGKGRIRFCALRGPLSAEIVQGGVFGT